MSPETCTWKDKEKGTDIHSSVQHAEGPASGKGAKWEAERETVGPLEFVAGSLP